MLLKCHTELNFAPLVNLEFTLVTARGLSEEMARFAYYHSLQVFLSPLCCYIGILLVFSGA